MGKGSEWRKLRHCWSLVVGRRSLANCKNRRARFSERPTTNDWLCPTLSRLGHLGERLLLFPLHFLRRHIAGVGCERPSVSVRIDHLPVTIAPEHLHYRHLHLGPSC